MGLLDSLNTGLTGMQNPQSAGLLGLAQGLLSASGPSRMPVPLGAALGAGLGDARQAQAQAQQMQGAALQNQIQRLNLARTQSMYQLFEQAMHGALGNAAPGHAAPAAVSPGQALSLGAQAYPNQVGPSGQPINTGGVGPTNLNASLVGRALPGSGAPGAAPAPGVDPSSNPFLIGRPASVSPSSWMIEQFLNPQLTTQVAAGNLTPTQQVKNALFATGGNQQAAQSAVGQILHKQGYIEPVRGYGGGYYWGSNGKIIALPTAAPPGFVNMQRPDGSWSVEPVGGGTSAVRASSAARAGGQAQYHLEKTWDPAANNGAGGFAFQPVANIADGVAAAPAPAAAAAPVMPGAPAALTTPGPVVSPAQQADRDAEAKQLLAQELQAQQQRLSTATTPQEKQLAQANITALQGALQQHGVAPTAQAPSAPAQPGATLAEPPLAAKTAQEGAQEYYWKTLVPQAENAKQTSLNLTQMQAVIDNPQSFSPGAGAELWNKQIAPWLTRLPGHPFGASVMSFQDFEKNSTQLATSAARTMGAREPGSIIQMFRSAYPNANQTQAALQVLVSQQKAATNYSIAEQQYVANWAQTHGQDAGGGITNWNRSATKQAFLYEQLATHYPPAFKAYVDGLSKADRAAAVSEIKKLQSLGIS